MDEARYLRRGALIFIPLAFLALAFAAVNLGPGNMIPGIPGNAFSLVLVAGLLGSAVVATKKW